MNKKKNCVIFYDRKKMSKNSHGFGLIGDEIMDLDQDQDDL